MIKFYGYSDDCAEVESYDADGKFNGDEFDDCAQQTTRSFLVGDEDGGLVVRLTYAPKRQPADGPGDGATWQIAVDLVDEDVQIPWIVTLEHGGPAHDCSGYTPVLIVHCPNGTPWRML